MRIKTVLVLGGLCAVGGGCSRLANVSQSLSGDPAAYSRSGEGTDSKRNAKLAELAWDQTRQANPEVAYSVDFAAGFKKGFADYLQPGSTGELPVVPPSCYGRADYETTLGRQTVQDWFRGFREGTVQAQVSGLRPVATVPASVILPTFRSALPGSLATAVPQAEVAEVLPPLEAAVFPSRDARWNQRENLQAGARSPL